MHRRIVICGKSGAGKDYLRDACKRAGLRCDLSATTRPPREGELDGVAYHFYSESQFTDLIAANEFYEHVTFNGWHYGTLLSSWKTSQVFIMTPGGISKISAADRAETCILYLDMDESVRRERIARRIGNADDLERRLAADALDFAEFDDYDWHLTSPDFDVNFIAKMIQLNLL